MATAAAIAKVRTYSPAETQRLGQVFGQALAAGDLVNLQGDLGAGKTLFVKGIARSLGYDPEDVQSPTFTLVHEHRGGRLELFHLDLYRLDDPLGDVEASGLDEYLDPRDGVTAVEWGERAREALAARRFDVAFEVLPDGRRVTFWARGMEPRRLEAVRNAIRSAGFQAE